MLKKTPRSLLAKRQPQKVNIPIGKQWLGKDEIKAVISVLKSDFITQGPKVKEFEESFARRVNARYAVAVSSGTAALHIAALALGLGPGDEVITTPITFLATANAILYAGAKPVFADIESNHFCLDPAEVEKKITPKTRAIFPVHLGGHPACLSELSRLCRKNGLWMLEDACHALGARYQNTTIGDCTFSRGAVFSFHPVKHITTGEGGMVTTQDEVFYERLCDLRNHGVTRQNQRFIRKNEGPWYYEMQGLGFNYRMTDIQAALGICQLEKLDQFVQRRREIANAYRAAFTGMDEVILPEEAKDCLSSFHLFILRLQKDKLNASRREIFEQLKDRGVGVQVHYIPVPSQPFYREQGYREEDSPQAGKFYQAVISLPIFPKMTVRELNYVIRQVKDVVKTSRK